MIPKTIHTVFPGKDIFGLDNAVIRHTWMEHNCDYNFMFWRNNSSEVYLSGVNDILTSDKYTVTVKSDILRLAVLHTYGGIYADTDMVCMKNFDGLLNQNFIIGYERQSNKQIGLSLVGCTKGDAVIKECLLHVLDNVKKADIQKLNTDPIYHLDCCSVHALQGILKARISNISDAELFYPIPFESRANYSQQISEKAYTLHLWAGAQPNGWVFKAKFA